MYWNQRPACCYGGGSANEPAVHRQVATDRSCGIEFQPESSAVITELLERVKPQSGRVLTDGLIRVLERSQTSSMGSKLAARFPR